MPAFEKRFLLLKIIALTALVSRLSLSVSLENGPEKIFSFNP